MKTFAFAGAVSAAVLALSACTTSVGPPPPTERPVVEATACPDLTVDIYFEPASTATPESAAPVLATVRDTIASCDRRFSHVRRVEIAAFANRGADGATAEAMARARAQSLKAEIVKIGVPARRVKIVDHSDVDDDPDQPLRRHAHIVVKFNVER